jgi:hypothetical protein
VLIVAFVAVDFLFSGNGKALDLSIHALLVAGFGGFGWSILRMSETVWEQGHIPSSTEVESGAQPRVQ